MPDYPGGGADRVTVHQLLNHTSGLAQWDRSAAIRRRSPTGSSIISARWVAEALLARCCSGPLAREPGRAFDYNNADYFVLGRIVERLTGKSFEAALAERILRPLGLDDTGMAHWDRIVERLAPTYFWRDDTRALVAEMPVYWENCVRGRRHVFDRRPTSRRSPMRSTAAIACSGPTCASGC